MKFAAAACFAPDIANSECQRTGSGREPSVKYGTSRVDQPLLAFTLTEPDVRRYRIRLFRAGNPVTPGAKSLGG
jgi:hypothetical protein